MAKAKLLNVVVRYMDAQNGECLYIVNDLGVSKSPRFELSDKLTLKVIEKSDNPIDFDEVVYEGEKSVELVEGKKKRRGRAKKSNREA